MHFVEPRQAILFAVEELAVRSQEGECPQWALSYEETHRQSALTPLQPPPGAGTIWPGFSIPAAPPVSQRVSPQSHRAIWASAMGALPDFPDESAAFYLHVAPMFHMADFARGMGVTLCVVAGT